MLTALWLIPALPLAGFILLALAGSWLPRRLLTAIGVGSVGLSALLSAGVAAAFISGLPPGGTFEQHLWTWLDAGNLQVSVAFHLDALALVMVLVVTFVGFLIHLYSSEFMAGDPGYARFFAAMNLFVAAMLILLLADNLVLLYLGWEGVGLCSYLLIGFWYRDPANGRAARKAFIVTRVGDTAMIIGLFLLFTHLGTLNIQMLMSRAVEQWAPGSGVAIAAAALLLGGAVGKSAQLPLQTWLPDAMAGPTPVSALIHAATMVTAGVYLIARTHALFILAPAVMATVALIGAITLLVSGFSALVQRDIKRVLAYSTISQVGYMFLALGVGAWSAAIFHFMTHAFFKALLFLGAGAIILAVDHEHDLFKMGGLRKHLPLTFWTFLVGAASLAALPLITAGFYSKDLILYQVRTAGGGGVWLWLAGLLGALLTGLYAFRMVFLAFFGEPGDLVQKLLPLRRPGWRLALPLLLLAILSLVGGLVETPSDIGHITLLSDFLRTALPATETGHEVSEVLLQVLSAAAALAGLGAAYLLYIRRPSWVEQPLQGALAQKLRRFWLSGWGFDWLYERLLARPYLWLAEANQEDVIDRIYDGIAALAIALHRGLSRTQTGRIRWYAAGLALGAVLSIALMIFL